MKRNLLIVASLFCGASAFAQFTDANAPQIGDGTTLNIIDSLAPNLSAVTGTGVTWDYSTTLGYENETRNITILDPAMTGNSASFGTSTSAQDVQGFLTTYTISSPGNRESQGFVFKEAQLGEVVARFNTNSAITHTYPMDIGGAAIVDPYAGEVIIPAPASQTVAMTGKIITQVDGKGTLKLWGGNNYTDVLRYKIIDTMELSIFPIGAVTMTREQYEYYDLANDRLPIFVHGTVIFGPTGGTPMSTINLVLSKDAPTQFVSVSVNELEKTAVYPNPTSEDLNIQLPSSIESADVVITDALGREVYASTLGSIVKTIDVSKLNKGMYFVNISNDVYSTTKNVVIK